MVERESADSRMIVGRMPPRERTSLMNMIELYVY